jgi:hypothetical protein
MIRYLVAAAKHAFGLHRPGLRIPVRPDDILLASYPKSGNTWTRFLIANLVFADQEIGFGNLHKFVLDHQVTVKRDFDRAPRPRIVKTHGSFDPRYRRVLYIVRDPRDVALSQYHYLRKLRRIDDAFPIEDFVERFLTGELKRFPGSWGENVGSWLATRARHPGFLLLRYEDLLSDTARELARVAAFAGLPATSERIAQAVERSSADKMRESEKAQGQRSSLIKGSRNDIAFVRAAKSGGWRTGLPEPLVARIEGAWGDIMACLGYELVTRDSQSALASSLIGLLAQDSAPVGDRQAEAVAGHRSVALPVATSSPEERTKVHQARRIINATRRVLGHTSPGRYFDVFDDDVFLVSFPKSGNTWTRFLIANLLHPDEPANFGNIDRLIPESEGLTRNELQRVPRPRIMKSHEYFDPRFRKVVYIVRDPRDVAISQFHFYRKRRRISDDYSIERFVTRFIAGDTSDYGSWGDNVASWLVARQKSSDFLLLRYEDLLAQTVAELTRVASFMGVSPTPELVAQAVERSSVDQMRKLEQGNATASVTRNTRQDIPFVRAAGSGGWRSTLPEKSVAELESAWAPLMKWLGYEPAFIKIAESNARVESLTSGAPLR